MILLAVSEFFRNLRRNLLLVILITVMALVLTFVMSVLLYELQKYAPFSQFQGKNGFYYCGENDYSEDCIKEKYYYYYTSISVDVSGQKNEVNTISLPRWIWSKWKPRMQNGSWFPQNINADAEHIPLIVGGSKAEIYYQIGEVFTVYTREGEAVSFEVVGILVDKTTVIASQNYYNSSKVNYDLYYSIPYDDYFFIVQDEYLETFQLERWAGTSKIIILKDNMTTEEAARLKERIQLEEEGRLKDLVDFNEANRQILMQELHTYMPLVAVGLLLVLICSYAAVYVNLAHNARHYSIFYLLGADERQRVLICMGNGLGVTLFSVLLLALLYYLAMLWNIGQNVLLMADWHTVLVLAAYYVLYMVLIGILSYCSMRGKTPKNVLRER